MHFLKEDVLWLVEFQTLDRTRDLLQFEFEFWAFQEIIWVHSDAAMGDNGGTRMDVKSHM